MRKTIVWIAIVMVAGAVFYVKGRNKVPTETPAPPPVATEAPIITEAPAGDRVPKAPAKAPAQATAVPNETVSPVEANIQKAFDLARPVFRQKAAIAASSNENVHTTPKQTIQAAQQLGAIVQLEEQHPDQAASFQAFYLDCAKDEAVVTVIRSQCLDHYVKLAKMETAEKTQFLSAFPAEVITLYQALQ